MNTGILVISADAQVHALASAYMRATEVAVHAFDDVRAASGLFDEIRFDAVVVDCDDTAGGRAALRMLRSSRGNRRTPTLAILNGGTTEADAVDLGANCTCHKPLSSPAFAAALQRLPSDFEHRGERRYPVSLPAYVSTAGIYDRLCTATNISLNGIGLRLDEVPRVDDFVSVRCQLDDANEFQAIGEIAWSDAKGYVGLKFISVNENARVRLQRWLQGRPAHPQAVSAP